MTLPQLDMAREERRFLLLDVAQVLQLLGQRFQSNQYRVRTLYVDTPGGTWSKDPTLPRYRLRIYDPRTKFIETKQRVPGTKVYVKKRNPVDGIPQGMVSLGESRYSRTEWPPQNPDPDTGLRVTVDQGLTAGAAARRLIGFVVETKLPIGAPLPNWLQMLLPYERPQFSKWSWVSG